MRGKSTVPSHGGEVNPSQRTVTDSPLSGWRSKSGEEHRPEREKATKNERGDDGARKCLDICYLSLACWKLLIPSKVLNHISQRRLSLSLSPKRAFRGGGKGKRSADDADSDLDLGWWKPFFFLPRVLADPGDIYGPGKYFVREA